MRGERRQHRRRDRAFLAQHRQPSLERGPVTRLDRLPPASMSEVPLNDLLIEIEQPKATACDPTQEPANHVEATPRAVLNESLFDETSAIALDEQSVRSASETPVQPASAQVLFRNHT
ncbi:hypothetical protein AC629_07805 [Bradyrhizobium sp. NAS80.1]|nr:hypothetical protein AC630_05635 [Bradyrhizobium sp. AS23.2]OKO88949.1 hypothetical protein AC629_07805 [Bradyrhizobium sp. NAS80.1]